MQLMQKLGDISMSFYMMHWIVMEATKYWMGWSKPYVALKRYLLSVLTLHCFPIPLLQRDLRYDFTHVLGPTWCEKIDGKLSKTLALSYLYA
eukprot:SAG31_NODE_1807_length_7230_cov_4.804885_5_plen_92_part_00